MPFLPLCNMHIPLYRCAVRYCCTKAVNETWEIAKSRPESRPRPRQRRDFFLGFIFEPRNRQESSNFAQTRSRSRREYFYSVSDPARSLSRDRDNIMIFLKSQDCVFKCRFLPLPSVARWQKFRPKSSKGAAEIKICGRILARKSSANFQKHQFYNALYIKNQI